MKCAKAERWISDGIDGVLTSKKRRRLERHLEGCASCRTAERSFHFLQHEALRIEKGEVPAGYWEDSLQRLRRKLEQAQDLPSSTSPFSGLRRWAWAAVPLFLLAIAGAYFLFLNKSPVEGEIYLTSGETLTIIYTEISENPGLENAFNLVLDASITEDLEEKPWGYETDVYRSPLLGEQLTEKEARFIEEEMRKEIEGSKGVFP